MIFDDIVKRLHGMTQIIKIYVHGEYYDFNKSTMYEGVKILRFGLFTDGDHKFLNDTLTKLYNEDIDVIISYGYRPKFIIYYNGSVLSEFSEVYDTNGRIIPVDYKSLLTDRNIKQANLMGVV